MKIQNRHISQIAAYTVAVIIAAVFCRAIAFSTENDFLDRLANFTRIFLYLGLFTVWGVSVYQRVLQIQVRRYLVTVVILMVLWLIIREFRWHLVMSADIKRWLWYTYYIGILPIPMLALFVSLSLGKAETYRLPRWTAFLYAPTILLLSLVLTNDLHQWVFVFPGHSALYAPLAYRYGRIFYLILIWGVTCALAAFFVMISKCRIPQTKKILWLPLIPFGIALLYIALYALRIPFVTSVLGDLAVFDCLLFAAFFEICIQCGLIQSNTRYKDLFSASVGISAQITDNEYVVRYAASDATHFSKEVMTGAENAPIVLPKGYRLHNMPVNGGHIVWAENIAELLDVQENLKNRQEELQDRNSFLQYAYAQEKEHRIVVEQNRLFDLLQDKTQSQLDQIKKLTENYQKTKRKDVRRRIIAHIVVLGSFIKRRKDFVLSMDSTPMLPESKLANALCESMRSLELLGIRGGCFVRTGCECQDGRILTHAYDFFECVVESVLGTARYLNVVVYAANGGLRCMIMSDCCNNEESLLHAFPTMQIIRDEDGGAEYLLPLNGSEA